MGVARKTQSTYNSGWERFAEFCSEFGFSTNLPVQVETLCSFIAYLSLKIYAHTTMSAYLSGIGFRHKVQGLEDPTNCFLVRLMLKGVRRGRSSQPDLRLPLTLKHLEKILGILQYICSSRYEILLFKAVFTLMFFGFLRIGEVAAASKTSIQESVLRRSDVVFQVRKKVKVLVINFRISKNNQFGDQQEVVISSHQNKNCCPLVALADYLNDATQSEVLFSHFDSYPLTKYQLRYMLKRAVQFCNFSDHHLFQSHSFRIGAATTAKMMGLSDEDIQIMGRWRSAAFKKYIRVPSLS